jgi:hypothetical protein
MPEGSSLLQAVVQGNAAGAQQPKVGGFAAQLQANQNQAAAAGGSKPAGGSLFGGGGGGGGMFGKYKFGETKKEDEK